MAASTSSSRTCAGAIGRTLPDGSLTRGFEPLWSLDGHLEDEAASSLPVTSRRIGAGDRIRAGDVRFRGWNSKGVTVTRNPLIWSGRPDSNRRRPAWEA